MLSLLGLIFSWAELVKQFSQLMTHTHTHMHTWTDRHTSENLELTPPEMGQLKIFTIISAAISSRTKDIKQFSQLTTHTHTDGRTHARTWVNLELTTRGGSAKKWKGPINCKHTLNELKLHFFLCFQLIHHSSWLLMSVLLSKSLCMCVWSVN